MHAHTLKEYTPAVSELLRLLADLSYRESDVPFKLSSGRTSTHFIDLKPTAMHTRGAKLIADLMIEKLKPMDCDLIGGMETGGIPLVASICARCPDQMLKGAFFVRKQAKGHGTNKLIDGVFYKGAHTVLIEDVTTTGGSILKAAEAIRAAGGHVSYVLTVVDREEGATEELNAHNLTLIPLLTLSDLKNLG
ncbi:MAG: orotate phosphoribosyltransferase [Proteobacteria bacterium]|nr:orotate phosphoribosyltransferase [Pseudomonadota bacterium]